MGPFSLEKNFNLIPFKNIVNSSSLYNIILTVPFGFLLPFICRMNLLKLLLAGIGFSGILELLQALAGILAGYSTRVIDINDLICNTAGAAAGYGLFLILGRWTVEQGGILGVSVFYTIVVAVIAVYFALVILWGYKVRKKQTKNT